MAQHAEDGGHYANTDLQVFQQVAFRFRTLCVCVCVCVCVCTFRCKECSEWQYVESRHVSSETASKQNQENPELSSSSSTIVALMTSDQGFDHCLFKLLSHI